MGGLAIERFQSDHPPDLSYLRRESVSEGHGFVELTLAQWVDGSNRFDRSGEGLFIARTNNAAVGMCGLNVDPFLTDPTVGRIRHLYVHPSFRRQGIGIRLVEECLDLARITFDRVRLRTFDVQAACFYAFIGFDGVAEETATHSLELDS